MTAKRPRRRKGDARPVPVPPPDFDPDAEVQALYAEITGAADAAEWRKRADATVEWAAVNDVELNPDWGGRITARWIWDDASGRVVPNR